VKVLSENSNIINATGAKIQRSPREEENLICN
jgi:hypothetical protein